MQRDLDGKVSLVAGPVRGNGRAIAARLVATGSTGYFSDVDEAGVEEASEPASGAEAVGLALTDPEQARDAVGFHDEVQQVHDPVPRGPCGTSDGVCVAVLSYVDRESLYKSGHVLAVDGGWTAGYRRDF